MPAPSAIAQVAPPSAPSSPAPQPPAARTAAPNWGAPVATAPSALAAPPAPSQPFAPVPSARAPSSALAAPAAQSLPAATVPAVSVATAPTTSALGGKTAVANGSPTPVTAAGGSLNGSAPPGGVPVRVPSGSASTAAAVAIAPGKSDAPKFDRTAFDVDFGAVFSGEQVRRTVVLNASARGEAEFSLSIPNAPGFSITEVRVMGQGASAPAVSKTQAPMPSGGGRLAPDSAVRSVASRATSPPWKVQFNGPAELQIDVLYAPTVDLFNNLIGKKMGVLNGAVRNSAGGEGASIALRADFRGLKEVNAASLKPREKTVYIVVEAGSTGFEIDFDVASLGTAIEGVLRQAGDVPRIKLLATPVRMAPASSGVVTVKGQFDAVRRELDADGMARTIPVMLTWSGGSSTSSVEVVPVPARKSFHTPMLSGCGVDQVGSNFRVEVTTRNGRLYQTATSAATTFNSDPLRTAYVQLEVLADGRPVCAAYPAHLGAGKSQVTKSDYNACSSDFMDYVALVRGPLQYRCRPLSGGACTGTFYECQSHLGSW